MAQWYSVRPVAMMVNSLIMLVGVDLVRDVTLPECGLCQPSS